MIKLFESLKVKTNYCCTQNGYTSHERARVEQMILEQENLLRDQANIRIDVMDLKRLAQIKVSIL